jgi:hypothetical protein
MNINIIKDDSNLNDLMIIFDKIQSRPNRLIIHDSFTGKDFEEIIESKIKKNNSSINNFVTEFIPSDNEYVINKKILKQIDENLWISYVKMNSQSDSFIINEVCFFYKDDSQEESIIQIVQEISDLTLDYDNENLDKVNTISTNNNLMVIDPVKVEFDFHLIIFRPQNVYNLGRLAKEASFYFL